MTFFVTYRQNMRGEASYCATDVFRTIVTANPVRLAAPFDQVVQHT